MDKWGISLLNPYITFICLFSSLYIYFNPMSILNEEFKSILTNIENSLNKALPAVSNKEWQTASFGKLSESVKECHLTNLISPNKNLIDLGGKRWRPLLLVLSYQAAKENHKEKALSEEEVYSITPLVEFVHTASLIHDDIEDSADLRRGKPAAHITYGLDTALNAASWLYFEAPVCINNLKVSEQMKLLLYQVYTNELRRLHLGQAMDIYWHRNPELFPTEDEYLSMVKCKTGTLAAMAAKTGCVAGGLSLEEAENYGDIAANIGIGFQIIDDVINLTSGNPGKKRGDDIVEGKKSLPVLIHVSQHPEDKARIADFMKEAGKIGFDSPAVENCIKLLESSDCIKKAAEKGSQLIRENCAKLNSKKIETLFTSMIPEAFR